MLELVKLDKGIATVFSYRNTTDRRTPDFKLDYEDYVAFKYDYLWFHKGIKTLCKKEKARMHTGARYIIMAHGVFDDILSVRYEDGDKLNLCKGNLTVKHRNGTVGQSPKGVWKRGERRYEVVLPVDGLLMSFGIYNTLADAIINYRIFVTKNENSRALL